VATGSHPAPLSTTPKIKIGKIWRLVFEEKENLPKIIVSVLPLAILKLKKTSS
jgi:hypothetical protein